MRVRLPEVHGVIERRLLVNYRLDPAVAAGLLPSPFRPQLVRGSAVVGMCLIRLGQMRPRGVPRWAGLASENAAHRFAVEWDDDAGTHAGVYIPRRDSDSCPNQLLGGRLYPGYHERAAFRTTDADGRLQVAFSSYDRQIQVDVRAERSEAFAPTGLFATLEEASQFFRGGCSGWSATHDPCRFDGIELRTEAWSIEPLDLVSVRASWFEDRQRFPEGSLELDGALVMRSVPVRWEPLASLRGSGHREPAIAGALSVG